ncbi:hypothetical protein HD806DRAFT_533331 [Xylariaceae sp. AK1471]|nr:hypothetical protein HD806DRAFT_533331 [Xylariaceae sp. AK1471]
MALLSILNQKKKAVTEKERRKSFGIGGAGNIRTPDQAIVPDEYDLAERRRRRMSSISTDLATNGSTDRRSSSISETLKNVFASSNKKSEKAS